MFRTDETFLKSAIFRRVRAVFRSNTPLYRRKDAATERRSATRFRVDRRRNSSFEKENEIEGVDATTAEG